MRVGSSKIQKLLGILTSSRVSAFTASKSYMLAVHDDAGTRSRLLFGITKIDDNIDRQDIALEAY